MNSEDIVFREQLAEILKGGFAPNIVLLREFDYQQTGTILKGLHFSAWILLGHIRARHMALLDFMRDPEKYPEAWPDAFWPKNHQPQNKQEWETGRIWYNQKLPYLGAPPCNIFI